MKRFLLILLTLLPFSLLVAQDCEPDQAYTDSTGVFPIPYDPDLSPEGGINECAVTNQPYDFPFTVAVGDSISAVIFGQTVTFPLDSVTVNSVQGLPVGLNYGCMPTTCSFPKNSLGCAVLYGTPLSSNTPGDYPLIIKGTAYFPVAPFFFDIDFPGPQFPGEYTLRLLPDDGTPCDLTSTKESLAEKLSIIASPNPASALLNIEINADIFGEFTLSVVDLLGKQVHREKVELFNGKNTLTFNGQSLANGMYIIVLESELGQVAHKITIQH